MLLSYIAHIDFDEETCSAFVYNLPVKYSVSSKNLSGSESIKQVLNGIASEMNSYLRNQVKRKFLIPLPHRQLMFRHDYDLPVELDVAFAMILRVFRANMPQKELANKLGKSQAYISSMESLEVGITLANAHDMLAKLGIKAAFCMIPYSYSENEPFQFAPDAGQKLPILTSGSMKSGFTLDSNRYASHLNPSDKRAGLVFPAQIMERNEVAWEKYTVFEITFPSLEKYNLNIRIVDSDRDTVINRAANILNMTLLSTDKKIEYPEFQPNDIKINIWIETAYKVFPKEMKKMIEEGVKEI